jgi:competence protein ComEC
MAQVIEGLTVKNVIMPRLSKDNIPTTATYENFMKAVGKSGAKVIAASPGAKYNMGEINFETLSPFEQSRDLNDMSVVIRLSYKDTNFLFTGDAETPIENQILEKGYNISADVLKVGHHGSKTSSSENFIKAVNPVFAVISCGKDNKYGHPHSETIKRFDLYGIEYDMTSKSGTIVVGSDGKKLSVSREKEKV